MKITEQQLNVLAHVVINPVEWVNHAIETMGEDAVLAKIEKYEPIYNEAILKEGSNYKNRVQRDEESLNEQLGK